VWSDDWESLGRENEISVNRIDDAIGGLRMATLGVLSSLH